jgi:hypothetical protein
MAWAALNLLAALALVLVPQRGHPPPASLLPLVALAWPVGHGFVWLVSWLAVLGRRRGLARGRPAAVVIGLLATGVAALLGIVQIVGSGVRGQWYPYRDPGLWLSMLLVWGLHGVCLVALLVRWPWSRHLAAALALGWALLLGWQLAEALITSTRTSSTELLLAAGLLVALLALAVAFVRSRAVKDYLGAGDTA